MALFPLLHRTRACFGRRGISATRPLSLFWYGVAYRKKWESSRSDTTFHLQVLLFTLKYDFPQ